MNELAVIDRPVAAVFKTPSGSGELADEALYGHVCRVQAAENGFVRILTHYGYTGYIESRALRPVSESEADAWLFSGLRAADALFLDVLAAPAVRAERLICIPAGALISALPETEDGWRRVRLADGREGYAPEKHLAEKRFGEDFLPPPQGFCLQKLLERWYNGREDSFRAELIRQAKRYLGIQYRWGGRSSFGVDCSGLVSLAYMRAGVNIYRDARIAEGFPIRKLVENEPLRPGDLLYFPGHVAMYIGGGRYIHATARAGSDGVVVNSLDPSDADFRVDLYESMYAAGGLR